MQVTADISMCPLDADYKPPIKRFVRALRSYPELVVVTNQLSTQVVGEYDVVQAALAERMREAMEGPGRVVFVVRYLNGALPVERLPELD